MKRILIINKLQFGYHTDYYFFSKYLMSDYLITFICMDYSLPEISLPGVDVKYIGRHRMKMIRSFHFIGRIFREIRINPYDLVMIYYFNYCSILRLLFVRKLFLLDIRTSSIKKNPLKRSIWNLTLRMEAKLFRNRTVLSDTLAQKLRLKPGDFHLLPLGAEEISSVQKQYGKFNLLYVGTLFRRNIEQTIRGFSYFYREYRDLIEISYTIIGFGPDEDVDLIRKSIRNEDLEGIVNFIGRIPYTGLKDYFDRSNIGISYIPITEYFDCQPPTKTFEYILSGLFCIATDTTENRKVINAENGVLCQDKPESFFQALKVIYKNRAMLDDRKIRNSLRAYTWENIVNQNFKDYLNQLFHV